MHSTLLNNTFSVEQRHQVALNIITSHQLNLEPAQILQAFQRIRFCLFLTHKIRLQDCIFLFDKLLSINMNMYIAIILALNDNFNPKNIYHFIIFSRRGPVSIGRQEMGPRNMAGYASLASYYKLLDYYDFDVTHLYMADKTKELIKAYRDTKYGGKMTKPAIHSVEVLFGKSY